MGLHHTSAHNLRDNNIASDCAEWKSIVLSCQTKWWYNPHPGCAEDVSSWVCSRMYHDTIWHDPTGIQGGEISSLRISGSWVPPAARPLDLRGRGSPAKSVSFSLEMQEMRNVFASSLIFGGKLCHLLLCQVSLRPWKVRCWASQPALVSICEVVIKIHHVKKPVSHCQKFGLDKHLLASTSWHISIHLAHLGTVELSHSLSAASSRRWVWRSR